ncbi:MAG TPA: pyrroline-5-carboxylate reductase, partial [Burkholderiales bacterium]
MRILFIGGGNMASALIGGMLQQGFDASELRVVEVSAEARERMRKQFGVAVAAAVDGAIGEDVVLLAVKPQQMREVARAMQPHLRGQLVVSIAAGIRTGDLSRWLGNHGRIVRAMPNTPALLRAGISGLFAAPQAAPADIQAAERILQAVGAVIVLDREEQLDGITAVSGSGPAYVFYFIEALQQAAAELGFSPEQARNLAQETFTGAARLAAASADPVETLRARVTSKAGTTEAALKSMEANEVKRRVVEAIHAAARRSKELGDEFGK